MNTLFADKPKSAFHVRWKADFGWSGRICPGGHAEFETVFSDYEGWKSEYTGIKDLQSCGSLQHVSESYLPIHHPVH
jgi:hypothetical protein